MDAISDDAQATRALLGGDLTALRFGGTQLASVNAAAAGAASQARPAASGAALLRALRSIQALFRQQLVVNITRYHQMLR